MPVFRMEIGDDGLVNQIFKDGVPCNEGVKLEQLTSVVTIYFQLAGSHLSDMIQHSQSDAKRRSGLQSFLMSLTGLEAFTNTYFHLRGQQLAREDIINRVNMQHGTLSKKIAELTSLVPDGYIRDQETIIQKIYELYQLRHQIMHPRWTPSSLRMQAGGLTIIEGLVENWQAQFEDPQLCREALFWCLLVVARIASTRGNQDVSGFMFHWTGNYGLTLPSILMELGLPPDQ